MSEPTAAEIEAVCAVFRSLPPPPPPGAVGSLGPSVEELAVRVLRAVLPDHDARVRAEVAEEIRNHADRYAGQPLNHPQTVLRRHLHVAARIAAGPMTPAEVAAALTGEDTRRP